MSYTDVAAADKQSVTSRVRLQPVVSNTYVWVPCFISFRQRRGQSCSQMGVPARRNLKHVVEHFSRHKLDLLLRTALRHNVQDLLHNACEFAALWNRVIHTARCVDSEAVQLLLPHDGGFRDIGVGHSSFCVGVAICASQGCSLQEEEPPLSN